MVITLLQSTVDDVSSLKFLQGIKWKQLCSGKLHTLWDSSDRNCHTCLLLKQISANKGIFLWLFFVHYLFNPVYVTVYRDVPLLVSLHSFKVNSQKILDCKICLCVVLAAHEAAVFRVTRTIFVVVSGLRLYGLRIKHIWDDLWRLYQLFISMF